jgi:hypothetical protein
MLHWGVSMHVRAVTRTVTCMATIVPQTRIRMSTHVHPTRAVSREGVLEGGRMRQEKGEHM